MKLARVTTGEIDMMTFLKHHLLQRRRKKTQQGEIRE